MFTASERRLPEKTSVVIARTLRAAILDGRLAPGEPLREVQLAEKLGTSRTPVREALILLEREGLVEGAANRGSTVKRYDRAELEELYNIRAALEGHAAREAAKRITPEVVEALWASCDRFARLRTSGELELPLLTEENLTFHGIILELAGSERLARMVNEVTALPSIHKAYMSYSDEHRETVEQAHRAITQALEAGDAAAAAELTQAHVLWAKDRALARFDAAAE